MWGIIKEWERGKSEKIRKEKGENPLDGKE